MHCKTSLFSREFPGKSIQSRSLSVDANLMISVSIKKFDLGLLPSSSPCCFPSRWCFQTTWNQPTCSDLSTAIFFQPHTRHTHQPAFLSSDVSYWVLLNSRY
ncbi:hypothetical protein SADUNF_Sadunf03G0055600 [Salix dunnii]|uniref:Uncharacterized protein n=1 Tax=Salix dunnii TaxID=1413687 RepID=A0A835N476_9ROSI|nr:hypothetical protein SADUNF_Sadunf03G0055600 [Salix dunnii]